jgi:hypothetical protein
MLPEQRCAFRQRVCRGHRAATGKTVKPLDFQRFRRRDNDGNPFRREDKKAAGKREIGRATPFIAVSQTGRQFISVSAYINRLIDGSMTLLAIDLCPVRQDEALSLGPTEPIIKLRSITG